MAIVTSSASASSLTTLLTRVRRAVGDTETDTANQRWSDAEITDAINMELDRLFAEESLAGTAPLITSTTLSYTAAADSVALPTGPDTNPIYMVEDYTTATNPIRLDYISPLEIQGYDNDPAQRAVPGAGWSRLGANIAIRPNGAAKTLRIWYLKNPPHLSGSTDQHYFPVFHEELLSLGAAIRLQEVDDEIPPIRLERYAELTARFMRSKRKNKGPQYVRRNRKWK